MPTVKINGQEVVVPDGVNMIEAAAQLGAPFVDVRAAFTAALQGADRSSLFVANGHCNDAGYELLAKVVAEAVLAALD